MEPVVARTYRRDPKGTETGGQFTANPGGARRSALTYQRTYVKGQNAKVEKAPKPERVVTPPAGTLMRDGENGPKAMAQLHALLTELGLGEVDEDGTFGEKTEAAVMAAQAKLGVKKPTGRATPDLVRVLQRAHALSPCIDRAASKVTAALGHDITPGHDELHHYWTRGKGLARWVASPTPWTTLVALLSEHVPVEKAKRFASAWLHEVTGNWPGSDAHRVATGHPPRGQVVGPG